MRISWFSVRVDAVGLTIAQLQFYEYLFNVKDKSAKGV
jgi:hypothetical protein